MSSAELDKCLADNRTIVGSSLPEGNRTGGSTPIPHDNVSYQGLFWPRQAEVTPTIYMDGSVSGSKPRSLSIYMVLQGSKA
jgi:hypothetical protein